MIGLAEFQISTLLSAASSRQSYSSRLEQTAFSDQKRSPMNPSVSHLLSCVDTIRRKLREDSAVTCLITDSRRVVPGALFFAIGGLRTDGNLFVEEAVDRGAVAIITKEDLGHHFPIDYIQVADVRQTLALISRDFYHAPDAKLGITGITGTNGKTTVSMLTQYLIGGQAHTGVAGL